MKLFKQNKNEWVLVSEVEKLLKENNMEILLDTPEKEDCTTSIEFSIYPKEIDMNDDFNSDDHISYVAEFNNRFNKDYEIKLNYIYQMEISKEKVPEKISSLKDLSKLFKEINQEYKKYKISQDENK